MSKTNEKLAGKHRHVGAICQTCRHNLFVRGNGKVYCSNRRCRHHRVGDPHPAGRELND